MTSPSLVAAITRIIPSLPGMIEAKNATPVERGYPAIRHVERIIDGPIVWAPALMGAPLLSLRGGDFELAVGRDVSIGYLDHDLSSVRLYLEESLTFQLITPEAAVPLQAGS